MSALVARTRTRGRPSPHPHECTPAAAPLPARSNINACMALTDTVRTTLGPCGMDKLIHDDKVGGGGGG